MDRIFLRDLHLACTIGVNDWEREIQQPVRIDVDLEVDLKEAAIRDVLDDSVDYKRIRDRIEKVVVRSRFHLIEALAEAIANECLSNPRIHSVRVRVEKPGALRATRTVGVEMHRSRNAD